MHPRGLEPRLRANSKPAFSKAFAASLKRGVKGLWKALMLPLHHRCVRVISVEQDFKTNVFLVSLIKIKKQSLVRLYEKYVYCF